METTITSGKHVHEILRLYTMQMDEQEYTNIQGRLKERHTEKKILGLIVMAKEDCHEMDTKSEDVIVSIHICTSRNFS